MFFFETSSKANTNIKEMFNFVANCLFQISSTTGFSEKGDESMNTVKLEGNKKKKKKKKKKLCSIL